MRSSNPAFSEDTFRSLEARTQTSPRYRGETMTVQGTVNKSFFLLFLLILSATYSWQHLMSSATQGWEGGAALQIPGWYFPVLIGSLVLSFVIIFKKTWARFLAPVYAICQGFLLGTLSAYFESIYPGIAFQAVLGTGGCFLTMLTAYRLGWIKVTEKFRSGMVMAIGGVAIAYLATFILSFFGISVPFIHGSGPMGVGFSVIVVGLASFSLLLDFDSIEAGARSGAAKHMEWYAAFGLMVTLVWLYLEILRLLAKLQDRR